MSSFNTRHIIHGATGGSNDDTTAYNDVLSNGSTLTFTSINGDQKSVSVTGGGTAVTAYNSVSVSGNDIVFGKTDGTGADTQPLGGLTAITDLQTLTAGHTTDIDDLESREQFKSMTQHPDVTNAHMDVNNPTVNGLTYVFSESSFMTTTYLGRFAFHQSRTYGWVSSSSSNHDYDNAAGGNYDYSGTQSLGGISGEWLQIQLPQAVILSSFSMAADGSHGIPVSFKVLGSTDGTNYDLLGEYTDVTVATTDEGSNFKIDTSLAAYGNKYTYYGIVVTRVTRAGAGTNKNLGLRHLRFFSVSKDVSDTIATAATSFYDATITGSNILNLISDSGTTSLTLPAGGTATSVDAITLNFSVQTVSGSNKYFLNGEETPIIELLKGHKYIFTFPAAHPLKLSPSIDGGARDGTTGVSLGNAEYTTGVTYDSTTQLTFTNTQVSTYLLNNDLYYYCENHANMGGDGAIVDDNGINNITSITYDNSVPKLVIERAYHSIYGATPDDLALSDSYTSAAISGSDLTLNRISGTNATTITLPSGGGGTSTTQHPSAMTSNSLPSPLVAVASTEYNLLSKAYHAFDNDNTIEWVSHSNRYDVTTGDALQTGFSGTPPTNIYMNPGSGYWATINLYYTKVTSDETNTFVRYALNVGATYGIEFSMNGSNELELEVNDSTHGTDNPGTFKINGGTAQSGPAVVSADDTIEIFNTAANGGGSVGEFTVPSELAIVVESKLASTTDVGEYLKIDLGSAMEAETLTLKSVAEYKEPRINMTAINQGDYEVTASSSASASGSAVYELFNSLTTPSTDYWVSDVGKYNLSTGNYSASANLGTDFPSGGTTVDGEYVAITLPDKRKLVGYKLTKPDASTDDNSPKAFKLYARENSTSAWVLLTSESLTTAVGEYVSGDVNTGGTRFPSTGDLTPTTAYQTYALVFQTIFTSGTSYSVWLSEFQLFCQPAEIENFKLYGSLNGTSWTPIHDQSTSANITSSGTDFTITNPGSYQHYGLVVTKNTGYHNVSLGEMKLGVSQTVNLSEYYKLADWKTLIAGCADFAAFKTAVAAL